MDIGISLVGGLLDRVVDTLVPDKATIDLIKQAVTGGGANSTDTLTDSQDGARMLEGASGQQTGTEWMAGFTAAFQLSREAMARGYASSEQWEEKFASAVATLGNYFDLLDTAAGLGGKDGFIGRNDLEAALNNPDLPQEVKDACRFLLDNPAAFNQLDVGAGINGCDGIIARCDLEAVLRRLAERAEQSGPIAENDGVEETGEEEEIEDPGIEDPETGEIEDDWEEGDDIEEPQVGPPRPGSGDSGDLSAIDFTGMNPEEIVEALMFLMMEKLDDALVDTAKELQAAQDRLYDSDRDSKEGRAIERDISRIQLKLQKLMEQRKAMFELLSTMSRLHHEMCKTALQNMGRA